MYPYLGDFAVDATVYVPWHTFDSNDPAASVTISGLAVTDIEIYKNGSVTQRASDNGYTLLDTDGIDFDGITGIHGFSIDASDNSDAGFFAAGNEYKVVISSITVDAATINFISATFSIERSGGAIAQLKAMLDGNNRVDVGSWLGNAVTASGGNPDVNVESIDDIDAPTTWKASINAEADTAISDAALATAAALAVVDGIADDLKSGIIYGAAVTGTLSTTQATTDLTGYADDQLIGRVIVWLSGAAEGEATDITDSANASGLLTFTALTTAPGNGDLFKIV